MAATVCLVGEQGVGKTYIFNKLTKKCTGTSYCMSVKPSFAKYENVVLYDLPGCKRFLQYNNLYLSKADACIAVYNNTVEKERWKKEIYEITRQQIPILFCTKSVKKSKVDIFLKDIYHQATISVNLIDYLFGLVSATNEVNHQCLIQ